jgi:hypothetical protein
MGAALKYIAPPGQHRGAHQGTQAARYAGQGHAQAGQAFDAYQGSQAVGSGRYARASGLHTGDGGYRTRAGSQGAGTRCDGHHLAAGQEREQTADYADRAQGQFDAAPCADTKSDSLQVLCNLRMRFGCSDQVFDAAGQVLPRGDGRLDQRAAEGLHQVLPRGAECLDVRCRCRQGRPALGCSGRDPSERPPA